MKKLINTFINSNSAIKIFVLTNLFLYFLYVPAFLYLYGYWKYFNVKFYEYLQFNEIIKYNLASTIFLTLFISILLLGIFHNNQRKNTAEENNPQPSKNKKTNWFSIIIEIIINIVCLYMLYQTNKMLFIAFFVFIFLIILYRFNRYVELILFALMAPALGSYLYGIHESAEIENTSSLKKVNVYTTNESASLPYIGRLGETNFYLDPNDKSKIITINDKEILKTTFTKEENISSKKQ